MFLHLAFLNRFYQIRIKLGIIGITEKGIKPGTNLGEIFPNVMEMALGGLKLLIT